MRDSQEEHLGRTAQQPMILVLGTADWNQVIATNQHYMVRELAREFPVMFSESLGLRRPEVSPRDLGRMARRLVGSRNLSFQRDLPPGVVIAKPVIIPLHTRATRAINRRLLTRLFHDWIVYPGPRILWTYSPLTYGFEEFADVTVYHCVDLLGAFPQIPQELVSEGEANLAENADMAFASSLAVFEHLDRIGFSRLVHWPNVADVEAITQVQDGSIPRVPGRALFAGNFSDRKVDFDLLSRVLECGIDLHLAGPISEGGGNAASAVQELIQKGATYHGVLPMTELAKLCWSSSIGLIPYALNTYTKGVNPLKTFEYLAAGMHVVSTAVPAVQPIRGHVNVDVNEDGFVASVLENASAPTMSQLQERREIAKQHSWVMRGAEARSTVLRLTEEDC